MATFAIKTVISAVDNITGPLKSINQSIKNTFKPIRDLHNSTRNLAKELGFPKIGRGLVTVKKSFGEVGEQAKKLGRDLTVMAGVATATVSALAWRTSSVGDAAAKTAQKVGMSTQSWTELTHAADLSGVSTEKLQTNLTKLNKNLFAAASGNKQAAYWFDAAGVSIYDANGKLRSADSVLGDVAEKFADPNFTNGSKRAALAMGLFGESGVDLLPLLAAGKDGIEAMRQEAIRLGITFTDLEAKQAEAFGDSMTRVKKSIDGVIFTIGKKLLPRLTGWADKITNLISANRELIGTKVDEWLKKLDERLPDIEEGITVIWDSVTGFASGVDDLVQSLGGWNEILPYVAGGLALIKLWPLIASVGGLAKAVVGLGFAFLTTPIGIVITLAAGLYLLAKKSSFVRAALLGLAAALTVYGIGKGFSGITSAVGKLMPALPTLTGLIKLKTVAVWGSVKALYAMAAAFLATPIGMIAAIVGVLVGLAYLIYDNWDWIGPWLEGVWISWKWAAGEVWGWIKNIVVTVCTVIADFLSSVWNKISSAVTTTWNGILGYFDGIFGRIRAAFQKGFLEGVNAIFKEFNPLFFIANALEALFEYFTGISLYDVGVDLINGLWDGLKSMWGNVTSWLGTKISELTGWMPDFVKDKLGLSNIVIPVQAVGDQSSLNEKKDAGETSQALEFAQRRAERQQALMKAQATVYFENVPQNVSVDSKGFTGTTVQRAPISPAYNGMRMVTS